MANTSTNAHTPIPTPTLSPTHAHLHIHTYIYTPGTASGRYTCKWAKCIGEIVTISNITEEFLIAQKPSKMHRYL